MLHRTIAHRRRLRDGGHKLLLIKPARRISHVALAFPGQGAQRPGMGADLARAFPCARRVFDEVDDALQQNLSRLMFEGSADEINATTNTQPALLAHSVAVLRVLEAECAELLHPLDVVLGHSVGEYAALVAAGALTLRDAARLLRVRADAMQAAAVDASQGSADALAMFALVLSTSPPLAGGGGGGGGAAAGDATAAAARAEPPPHVMDAVRAACASAAAGGGGGAVVDIAAVNSPLQVVLSGHAGAVGAAAASLRASGVARRAVRLPVSAPFHCGLMRPAADALRAAIAVAGADGSGATATLSAPRVPIVCNATAEPTRDAAEIRRQLVAAVTAPVRWAACAAVATSGGALLLELGPGSTLTALLAQQQPAARGAPAPPARARAVGTVDDVRALVRGHSAATAVASATATADGDRT